MDIYLILGETPHGKRYWRTGTDPDLAMDRADRRLVFGPALVGPEGYATEQDAAEALADFDLHGDPATWPMEA